MDAFTVLVWFGAYLAFCDSMTLSKDGRHNVGLCLEVLDKRLFQYIDLGCRVTYEGDVMNCVSVTLCPSEIPVNEAERELWLLWESHNADNWMDEIQIVKRETNTTNDTETAVNVTKDIPSKDTFNECLRYRRAAVRLYENMGCTAIKGRRCYIIKDCPSVCEDESGHGHDLGSEPWFEGIKQCKCEQIRHVRAFLPRRPRGAPDYPPYKHCYVHGCILPENDQYLKPSEHVVRANGDECVCEVGPDPYVQDDAPLFHLSCGLSH